VDAREAVRSLTAGRGVDFTFITSGSPQAIELGLGLAYCTGRLRLDALVTTLVRWTGSTMPSARPGEVNDSAV